MSESRGLIEKSKLESPQPISRNYENSDYSKKNAKQFNSTLQYSLLLIVGCLISLIIGNVITFPRDYIYAMCGGLFIGASASTFAMLNGRIFGLSGIFCSNLTLKASPAHMAVLSGLFLGGYFVQLNDRLNAIVYGNKYRHNHENVVASYHPVILIVGGILVGYGTRLGSGCTSGHGVCGLGRQSLRSLVAVGCFMGTGMLTSFVSSKLFPSAYDYSDETFTNLLFTVAFYVSSYVLPAFSIGLFAFAVYKTFGSEHSVFDTIASFGIGCMFSFGLAISGMLNADKIRGFLNISKGFINGEFHFGIVSVREGDNKDGWDPSLALVMCCALSITTLTFPTIVKRSHSGANPYLGSKWFLPKVNKITKDLIIGSIIFGIGFGLSGICPGPSYLAIQHPYQAPFAWLWLIGMIIGMKFYGYVTPNCD